MREEETDKSAEDFFELAFDCDEKGDFDAAIENYSKAIVLDAGLAEAFYNRGLVYYYEKKDYDRAAEDFDHAVKLDPDNADALFYRALADYDRAIALNPGEGLVYLYRGRIHALRGDLKKAVEDYNKAIELKPDDPDAYILRGIASFNKGEYFDALADLLQLIGKLKNEIKDR
jgi:tetratricopeptide (TPR) repeat protein